MRRSAPTIVLEPRASRWAVAVHAVSALSLIGVSLYLGYDPGALLALGMVGVAALARVVWVERARARVRLVLQPDGGWHWRQGEHDVAAALIDSADLGACIGLRFRVASGGVRHLALWPDSVDRASRRALIVWLRASGSPRGAGSTVAGALHH